ncbi:MAG: L-threonylcarbamoyladenylate synthase [Clostridia bacterium]|nr:L-threonylcarbamoyladenylate synthase [Clostridia bacterium]
MKTKVFDVKDLNKHNIEQSTIYDDTEANEKVAAALGKIDKAAQIIIDGGLVAFPTETVYGLGANALDPEAVAKIFAAKGRPADNPLIVHIARASNIGELTPVLTPEIIRIIDSFWPGPLTIVLPKKENVPDITTGELKTVAIRMPDNPVALELIKKAGCPVAAPSANVSGRPSPTKGEHVVEDLDGKIDAILIGDDCRVGIESTVLDLTGDSPTILRPGIITAESIEAVIGKKVEMDPALNQRKDIFGDGEDEDLIPKAPGMKYKHYAPNAEMLIIEGHSEKVKSEIERLKGLNEKLGLKVGVILFEERAFIEAAHEFFAKLREMDDEGVDLILAGALSEQDGVGFAVMNRMLKSAGYHIAKV